MTMAARSLPTDTARGEDSLDILSILFLASALIAPMDVLIFRSFTAYDLLIAVVWVFLLARGERLRGLPPMFLPPIYLFLLFALVSTFRATYPIEALTQELQFAFIFFVQVPVILTVVRSASMLRRTLVLFAIGSLIPIAVAMVAPETSGAQRFLAFYNENPNRLGYPTAYLAPFVLYFLIRCFQAHRRLAALVLGPPTLYLMIWGLAASASRGAAAGAIVAVLTFVVLRDGAGLGSRALPRLVASVALLGAIGLVLAQTEYFPSTLSDRVQQTFTSDDDLVDERLRLDAAGLEAFRDSPLVGLGFDNFRYEARLYGAASDQAPHNMWIQFLAQIGLLGAAAFLVIVVQWILVLLRAQAASRMRWRRQLLWAFLASILSLMAIYMNTPLMIQRHYWLIMGLGMALALSVPEQRDRLPRG